jgi:hypothetical protein
VISNEVRSAIDFCAGLKTEASGRSSNYTAFSSMAVKLFFFIVKSVKTSFVSDSESVPILCHPISKLQDWNSEKCTGASVASRVLLF